MKSMFAFRRGSRRHPRSTKVGALMPALALLVFLSLSSGAALAQQTITMPAVNAAAAAETGIIGKVVSTENGSPLAFATLILTKLAAPGDSAGTPAGGALSKPDGSYRIKAAPGHYRLQVSFVSYNEQKITGIEVKAGDPIVLDIALVPTAVKLETIEVTAYAIQNSEVSVLAQQRKSAAVSDGVSSQQISKTTDSNAAEVLQRVTGLSIVGGRYVYVRGLGERYSSTQVNGSTVGTPEPNKRVVPLDLFAAGLLDNVVVQKTYTPDQPGEFGGGVVNVNTRDFPGRELWDLSVSTGFNSNTTGKPFYTYDGGDTDFLGIDDGTRKFPDLVKKLARNERIIRRGALTPEGFSADTIGILGRSFSKTWSRQKKTGMPSYSVSGSYGNEVEVFDRSLGFLGSLSYSNSFSSFDSEERFFKADEGILSAETDYDVSTSEMTTLWGLIANSSYRLSSFHTLSLRSMYNRSSEDETRFYEGENQDSGRPLRNTRLSYIERGLFSGSVGTSHYIAPLNGATLDLRFSYSDARRNEPDRREYNYELFTDYELNDDDEIVDSTSVWRLSQRTASHMLTRMFGKMAEQERVPEVNLTVPFRQWNQLDSKFKTGILLRNKDRDSAWRRFYFRTPAITNSALRDSLLALDPAQIMTDEMIGGRTDQFRIEELTLPATDNYRAHQDITAGYGMFDLPLSTKVRAVFGARVERAEMHVASYDIFGLTADSLLSRSNLENTDWLPSVNLTYSPSDRFNARVAYSATVSRPDFRELSSFFLTDYVSGYPEVGNPALKRAKIHNYDLRFEFYPGLSEILAASLFYKDLIDPIEKSILGGSNPVYKPINGEEGELFGAELETRFSLGRVHEKLDSFAASFNWTLVHSETNLAERGIAASQKRPLEGQSPYVVNTGIFYASASGRTNASILYNVFGKRLSRVGLEQLPNIYERPKHSLDMTMSRRVGNARLKLSIENILDSESRFEQRSVAGGQVGVTHRNTKGRSISLSLSTGA